MSQHDTAAALLRAAFLREVNDPADVARLARLPVSVVLDALRSGEMVGREFGPLGWRVTKRAALNWLEGRATPEASGAA